MNEKIFSAKEEEDKLVIDCASIFRGKPFSVIKKVLRRSRELIELNSNFNFESAVMHFNESKKNDKN